MLQCTVFNLLDVHVSLLRELNLLVVRRVGVEGVPVKPLLQDLVRVRGQGQGQG